MSEIRAFIAFNFSEEIYSSLDKVTIDIKKRLSSLPIRWVPVHNIHLTIKFLGNITPFDVEKLKKALSDVSHTTTYIKISLLGSGTFPSYRRPRVIWIGLKYPPKLEEFQRLLEDRTAYDGFPREKRKFSPHITIGRVAKKADKKEITEIGRILENINIGQIGTDCLNQVHIFSSDLNRGGPVYNKLFTASFSNENKKII